jgi:hypothetical protein
MTNNLKYETEILLINKRPTKASKNQCISILIHSYIFRPNWATIQQAHTELPEDGAYETPKHVRVN